MRTMFYIAASCCAVLAVSPVEAAEPPEIISQPVPDSPHGQRNQSAGEGLSQYDFLIGDWDVDITFRPPAGGEIEYKAQWHNIWIVNGTVVFQEWRGPYATGAEFRQFDAANNVWNGRNIYTGAAWYETVSRWNDETKEMVVRRDVKDSENAPIKEEIYHDISANSFKIKTRESLDDGESWQRGRYELTATRRQ